MSLTSQPHTSDRYAAFIQSQVGRMIAQRLGLPMPIRLERFQAGKPAITGKVMFGISEQALAGQAIVNFLANVNAAVVNDKKNSARTLLDTANVNNDKFDPIGHYKVAIYDATGIQTIEQLAQLYDFFHPIARSIEKSGRVIVIGLSPKFCQTVAQASLQRGLEGFIKSVGKEFRRGITAQLIYTDQDGLANLESTLRFFASPRSAYVSGQVVTVRKGEMIDVDWQKPLARKTMLVTGASRGIGQAIANVLSRDGAKVICLDIEAQQADLQRVADEVNGIALTLDITQADAAKQIIAVAKQHGGLDAIIHNAGITRDKTLANMTQEMWDSVMNVNLKAEETINQYLLQNNGLNTNARIVCVASISGIAGNLGQTNYALSKAGVIGAVEAIAEKLPNGITINAVAPGFIETQMTAAMPLVLREAGRRMNAMIQGGLPIDVAETIAWLVCPATSGVNGQTIRVCGQSLLGA